MQPVRIIVSKYRSIRSSYIHIASPFSCQSAAIMLKTWLCQQRALSWFVGVLRRRRRCSVPLPPWLGTGVSTPTPKAALASWGASGLGLVQFLG